jgi:hypothetical protein
MLEEVRERTSSVLVSALGAWLGLGAGLALMVLSFLAVSWLVVRGDSSNKASIRLNQTLGHDLVSIQEGGASLSEDGFVLTLETRGEAGARSTVAYKAQDGRLTRTDDNGGSELIARLPDLRFSVDGNRLLVEWKSDGKAQTETWALERWKTP